MTVALDTNVLIRAGKPDDPRHAQAVGALSTLKGAAHEVCIVPQNSYELWVVATRPVEGNGLG